MSNHSPGPWVVFHNVEIRCPNEDNTVIARMEDSREAGWNTPTINANARLIAAAPDLLAALQDIVDAYQKHFDAMPVAWQTYDNIAREAIEKATGEAA
jgi:hypothetical protein